MSKYERRRLGSVRQSFKPFAFCICAYVLLYTACGIEDIVYLKKPEKTHDTSYLTDQSQRFCRFITAESYNDSHAGDYFQGTEIYYRIYERETDCLSDRAAIAQYNKNNPFNSAHYLQDSKKYRRLELDTVDSGQRPLIGKASADRIIRFRLEDYGTTDPALLTVNGTPIGVPRREGKKIFTADRIAAADSDVQAAPSGSSGSHQFWYVDFYAASYGYDKSFKTVYSDVEPLGYIKINRP